jgi:hypothetical protein
MKHPIIPNKKDLCIPSIAAIDFVAVYFIIYRGLCDSSARIDLASTNITFGITFAAFSVTALSLIALLQSKEHFNLAKKVGIYDNVVLNYRNSIVLSLAVLLFGLIGQLVLSSIDGRYLLAYNLFSVFLIVFISAYLVINVLALVKLLLMK